MQKTYLLSLVVTFSILAGCQNQQQITDIQTPQLKYPDWLTQESPHHCYPFDQHSARPVFDLFPANEKRAGNYLAGSDLPPVTADENTLINDYSLWSRLQSGFSLGYIDNRAVKQQLDWYAAHPDYMQRVQMRASRYMHHIMGRLEENGMPYDIALLPIVESAYEPFAYSHGQASGLWQFIPGTGKRFGLNQDWWFDGRRDAVQSTDAAIKYLKYLHQHFDGDWLLAIAAYNSGEGTVSRAIKKNIDKGKTTDFWHLDLPAETKAYVPKMIALVEIFRNPDKYSIDLIPIADKPYFGEVTLDCQLDLAQAAELANVSMEEIYYLNPGLNRWATPPKGDYTLKLPDYTVENFKLALSELDIDKRVTWQRHTIKKGETLNQISRLYNTDKQVIKDTNNIRSEKIVAGKTLLVPVASSDSTAYAHSEHQRLENRQNSNPSSDATRVEYHVQPGDTFWRIARTHHIDTQSLAKWNNRSPKDTLKIGEKLVIWTRSASSKTTPAPTSPVMQRPEKITRLNYLVRKGDSLSKVASKFNLEIPQIVAWNKINPSKYLKPGQALTLFVNVMDTY